MERCHVEIVRRLLERGADVDHVTTNEDTPLHGSVTGNKPVITDMLIKAGNYLDYLEAGSRVDVHTNHAGSAHFITA